MNTRLARLSSVAALVCSGWLAWGGAGFAAEPTALQLAKEGNQYVGEEARDRLVQIRSEKSSGTLTPSVWYVTYFDPDASSKATEVKFAAGHKVHIKRLSSFLGIRGIPKELPRDKIKVDSDRAITIAGEEPMLKNLTLKATQLTLEKWEELPVWRVTLWAARLKNPRDMAEIGEVFIAAEDGKVVRSDLKTSRVN
jgi:hypothetical protein